MAAIKLGIPFVKKGFEDETLMIMSADTVMDTVSIEVLKDIDGEIWRTRRYTSYTKIKEDFSNNIYEYLP